MKKILVAMLAVLLIGSFLFAGEETSRLKLSATVSEGPDNSGIRIMAGDMMEGITTPAGSEYNTYFGNLFANQSTNDLVVDAGDNVMIEDVNGFFSVLVYRQGGNNSITVNVSATPMRNEDGSSSYLPYKIVEKGKTNAVVNTLANPSATTTGATYVASPPSGSVGVRDIRVFEYLIPRRTFKTLPSSYNYAWSVA